MWLTDDPEYKRWRQAVVQTVEAGRQAEGLQAEAGLQEEDAARETVRKPPFDPTDSPPFDPTDFEYTDIDGTVRRSLEDDEFATFKPKKPDDAAEDAKNKKKSDDELKENQDPQSTKGKDDKKMLTDADLEAMIE